MSTDTMRRPKCRHIFLGLLIVTLQVLLVTRPWIGTNMKLRLTIHTANSRITAESNTTKANISNNKPRLNVIILTHIRSGSSFTGNLFNFHPDVFFLFEPLNELRMVTYGDRDLGEWPSLDEKANVAYRLDFSNLLQDIFKCDFKRNTTLKLIFPNWLRKSVSGTTFAWKSKNTIISNESIAEVCKSRKITVIKIMQTRLPRENGMRELQRVCTTEPTQFECMIIHLVRDPRAVITSAIGRGFFLPNGPKRKLITLKNTTSKGKEIIKNNTRIICSLVEENLNYVNEEWSNWFKDRYILVRYEDVPGDLLTAVHRMYNFTGLPMADYVKKWIIEGKSPGGIERSEPEFVISKNDVKNRDKWRFGIGSSLVAEFEEVCWPLMYIMGYISINGSEHLLHDTKFKLWTEKMPFSFGDSRMAKT